MIVDGECASVTQQPNQRLPLRDFALLIVWALLMYESFLLGPNGPPKFFNAAVLGGAVLCVSLEKSRIALVVALAVPLFGLLMWLRFPALGTGMMALGCGGVLC